MFIWFFYSFNNNRIYIYNRFNPSVNGMLFFLKKCNFENVFVYILFYLFTIFTDFTKSRSEVQGTFKCSVNYKVFLSHFPSQFYFPSSFIVNALCLAIVTFKYLLARLHF